MIQLFEIGEENWMEVAALSVREEQKKKVFPTVGI